MYSVKRSFKTVFSLLFILLSSSLFAQGPGGFAQFGVNGFGGDGQENEFLDQFDLDENGRLDLDERNTARASIGDAQAGIDVSWADPVVASSPGVMLGVDDVDIYTDEALYDESIIRTIFMEFENKDWETELDTFYDSDVDVPATVIVDGKTYDNVGVHFRGSSSFFIIPDGSKRSFNLSFNFIESKQRLLGYRTLNLLNVVSDPTFLRAMFYSHVVRDYIPAPNINFVRVVVNGENWGLFHNAQQFNTDFARDWFGSRKGGRWKVPGSPFRPAGLEYLGESVESYQELYKIRSKDKEESWLDLIEMIRVLNETPPEQLISKLSPLLDIDGALRFIALDMAFVNTDGYWMRASDYSLYQDGQGRFHIVPHDMNEVLMDEDGSFFGNGLNATADLSPLAIINDPTKPLHSKLLAVPELRSRYLSYVKDIAENWLDWEKVSPLLQRYHDLIKDDVERDTRKLFSTEAFYEEFDESSESVKAFIEARQAYLLAL